MISGTSAFSIEIDGQLADARPAEDVLDDDDATEEEAQVEADLDEDGTDRVAQGVAAQDGRPGQPFRACRPDVVAVELLDHRRPDEPLVVRRTAEADRERRRDDRRQVPRLVAATDREDVDVGQMELERRLEDEVAHPEARCRHEDDRRDRGRPVEPRSLACRGDDAERQADQELDEQARDRQLERRREALQDERQDVAVLGEGVPEVALEDVPDVGAELLQERAVQPEGVADAGDICLRGVQAPGGQASRIGRQDVRQEERHEGDRREHGKAPCQAADGVRQHRNPSGQGRDDERGKSGEAALPPGVTVRD